MRPSFVACLLGLCFISGDGPDPKPAPVKPARVPVVFHVRVPADTPLDAKVCLSGSLPAVAEWRETDARPMKRLDPRRCAVTVLLPLGETLKYKVTLGSWARVEKDINGREIDD